MTVLSTDIPVDAFRHCRAVTRQRARNFYYGLKLLPEPKRSALYAIYAWMRRADDIADEPGLGDEERIKRLEAFRAQTDAIVNGASANGDALWTALAFTVSHFQVPIEQLHALLDGQVTELRDKRLQTVDQLIDYCKAVASTVGLVCISIWAYDDDAAPRLAVDRGIAFQLTNIIRDFAPDFDSGRVYLPIEDFDQFDLTPEDLRNVSSPERCQAFLEFQIERARGYYDRSAPLDAMITANCRPTLWAMTSIYRELLDKAQRDPLRVINGPRLRLSTVAKAAIAVRARWLLHEPAPARPGLS